MKVKYLIMGLIVLFMMTGCNYNIIDTSYSYNKAICNYNGDKFELEIKSWTDYDGEQIQVKTKDNTYLLSANNCYLTKK